MEEIWTLLSGIKKHPFLLNNSHTPPNYSEKCAPFQVDYLNFINILIENILAFYYYYIYTLHGINSISSQTVLYPGDAERMRQKQKYNKFKNSYKSSEKRKQAFFSIFLFRTVFS